MQTYWQDRKYNYAEEFRRFMDEKVVKVPAQKGYKMPGTD